MSIKEHKKKPCEYCGCDLPLGVDKDTRRIRSRHFSSCKARPSLEVESPAPVPTSWMEMVAVNLLREGINKHKARELAEHFYGLAQRQWVGLTDEEFEDIELGCRSTVSGKITAMQKVEAKLKEKNT